MPLRCAGTDAKRCLKIPLLGAALHSGVVSVFFRPFQTAQPVSGTRQAGEDPYSAIVVQCPVLRFQGFRRGPLPPNEWQNFPSPPSRTSESYWESADVDFAEMIPSAA